MMMSNSQLPQSEKAALRERIKELTCLYDIAQIASRPNQSLDAILKGIVKILPSAWQYPETALARIVIDGVAYTTGDFPAHCQKQSAGIVVNGKPRGFIEIGYAEPPPALDEGPFLTEEQSLLNEVARQTAFIIERKQAEEDKLKLYGQLRHADRLATVGMLSAGVAHELNEPLGNILGFAQLAKKCAGLPKPAQKDIEKIEQASLHAREIIQKLLVFSGQVPSKKQRVNLNHVVEDGLYFFNARCAKEGIELVYNPCQNLPKISADPVQLNQVLVNLVVNALQSMPGAGRITVQTQVRDNNVCLVVEDTGPGIDKEVLEKIFVPFFTTKDIGQGTGLGLPVVHGIVTAHGGSIRVASQPGRGTRFEIRLPAGKKPDKAGNY
jgi:two-component system, NtrC family, sensor kinase